MEINKPILNFRDLLDAIDESEIQEEILLPVTHIPRWNLLSSIIKTGFLEPSGNNNHYKDEKLTFFTYGRNVFIPRALKGIENDAYPPFVLVFDLRKLKENPKRLLPFDSGGFDLYEMDEGLTTKNFEIEYKNCGDLKKLVVTFFQNSKQYLAYKHNFQERIMSLPFLREIKSLLELYNKTTNTTTGIGRQAKSFEVQFGDRIPAVDPILIICPHIFQTSEEAIKQINMAFPNAIFIFYEALGNPTIHIDNINNELIKFINENQNLFK